MPHESVPHTTQHQGQNELVTVKAMIRGFDAYRRCAYVPAWTLV